MSDDQMLTSRCRATVVSSVHGAEPDHNVKHLKLLHGTKMANGPLKGSFHPNCKEKNPFSHLPLVVCSHTNSLYVYEILPTPQYNGSEWNLICGV